MASRVNVTLGGRFHHYDILSMSFSPARARRRPRTRCLELSAGVRLSEQPVFLFVSVFPQNASLVPCVVHYVTGLPGRPTPSSGYDGRGVSENLHRLPGGEQSVDLASLANIGYSRPSARSDRANERRRGEPEGVELFVEEATHLEA